MNASNTHPSNWFRSPWLRRLGLVALGGAIFFYGIGVGHYQWTPFGLIVEARTVFAQWLPKSVAGFHGEQELLQYAFTDPVNETDLYYRAITSLEGIREANERIFIRRAGFGTAYRDLEVEDVHQLPRPVGAQPVMQVRFRYQGRDYEAFAYGHLPAGCDGRGTASLIIPGSGLNQSQGIATGDPANYHHGVLDALASGGNIYTLIKPNEDFLAWHDGAGRKLTGEFIWNWHVNREGSYSVSYLVKSLALTRWLHDCFDETIVAGLSQGGAAAMLNALQSKPSLAIVASGHSLLHYFAEWSAHNQLIGVPGYAPLAQKQQFVEALNASPTEWFFSWGKGEVGAYKIEAEERITASALRDLSNVIVVIHDDAHMFPVTEIRSFLETNRPQALQTRLGQ